MALRRTTVSLALGTVVAASLAVTVSHTEVDQQACDGRVALVAVDGACVHEDEPPPGVDPTEPVSTAVLRSRTGGSEGAYEAAEDLGVPTAAAGAVATPAVTCDGDGTSGYRVQAMYVVEAGRTNRYAALLPNLRLWAAGVDDVVNRSAALTGGVRNVRFVSEAGGAGCVARVLNVTVPAGSMGSFNSSIAAVQALGYTDPARKYLMWTDTSVLCGIASMYSSDVDSQANPNNGSYPQYARIDSGCWGFGDGAGQHSVEAHELLHTLGGVQNTAPHSTTVGHCWDESDTMCYADGGSYAMKQICPAEREYLLDCANDDYFSTFPDPGSYLDSHWNAADSRFLIGGGDGTGGGSLGTPTVLGATISVNNPAVPGLATQASVAPTLPPGREIASVRWRSARADCGFSAPTQLQTDVTCAATASAPTTVTATLVDSTGATKIVTSPLTFATGTARPVTLAVGAAGQSPGAGGTARVCTSAAFPVTMQVRDEASGQPVKGLAVKLTKQTTAMTTASAAGSGVTTVAGLAAVAQTATLSTTYRASTVSGAVYAAAGPVALTAVPGRCATALTAAADRTSVYYGDPVRLTGALSASVDGAEVVPAGATLTARLTTPAGKVLALGTTKTGTDGSYALTVKPTASGTVTVGLAGTIGYTAATASAGTVTVVANATALTSAVDRTEVGYGSTVRVTGSLSRIAGAVTMPLAGRSVGIYVTPAGGTVAVKVGAATTSTTGSYVASVPLRLSGTLSAAYAGAAGQPAAKSVTGPVVAGTWTTAVTARSSAPSVALGGSVTLSGTVSRAYLGTTQAASGVKVTVHFRSATAAAPTLVSTATTTSTGTFSVRVAPRATGTWTVSVTSVAGHADSTSTPLSVSVG